MPGFQAGSQAGAGRGPSYKVEDVQNKVNAVKGIMCVPHKIHAPTF